MPPEACVIPAVVVLVVLVWVIGNFNALVRLRQHVRESWSDIDAELKRRYDLIPNLVETVKGYAAHERQVLEAVVAARNRAVASTGRPSEQARDENVLVAALRQVFVLVEGYPQLKASGNFLALQEELANTEERIQAARRLYNANVRDYNTRTETFPSSLIAAAFGFRPADFFEIEDVAVRRAPAVELGGGR